MRARTTATLVFLALVLLAGAGYMSFGVFDLDPARPVNRVTVMLAKSGGLMSTSQVTMRGVKVGRVTDIRTTASGLAVSINLDGEPTVPVDSRISVENLSAAGEQYLEFKPNTIAPPYLTDGAVVPATQVSPTYTVSELLAKGDALISALDAKNLQTIISTVAQGTMDNTSTVDQLATATGLFDAMVQQDTATLSRLVGNISTLTHGLGAVDAGGTLTRTAVDAPATARSLVGMIGELQRFKEAAKGDLAEGSDASNALDKLMEYASEMSVPLTTFATVLEPITAPLRNIKIDAGHWVDFWDSTFSDRGGMRVWVSVPPEAQP